MDCFNGSLMKPKVFPRLKSDLDHLTDLMIKFQEGFYSKVFGIVVDFSLFSDLLKKIDIPSENMTVFISNSLSDEKLFSVAEKILGIKINLPKKRRDIKRKPSYIVSISRKTTEKENDYLSLRELIIMELFLKTQKNTLIHNYLPGPIICKGTRCYLEEKNEGLKYSNPFLVSHQYKDEFQRTKEKYAISYVGDDFEITNLITPNVLIYSKNVS